MNEPPVARDRARSAPPPDVLPEVRQEAIPDVLPEVRQEAIPDVLPEARPDGVSEALAQARVVPVVVLDDADASVPLGRALAQGGLALAEVTLRTPVALSAIEAMAADGRCLVGAGTVLSPAQVRDAAAAGARFVVSPGLDPDVVHACRQRGLLVLPGVATASEVQHAVRLGLDLVKLFPAHVVGGPAAVRALSGPFPRMRFVPTGGVSAADLPGYLALSQVLAVGGTWVAPPAVVAAADWSAVTRLAAAAVAAAEAVRPRRTEGPS